MAFQPSPAAEPDRYSELIQKWRERERRLVKALGGKGRMRQSRTGARRNARPRRRGGLKPITKEEFYDFKRRMKEKVRREELDKLEREDRLVKNKSLKSTLGG
jgi:hypothetical protein